METPSLHTAQLQKWVQLIRAGDRSASDDLLRATGSRLEALARKMLRNFPKVRSHEDTLDVMQPAVMRLLRALREVEPTSVRDFFGLAAEQMRRELLDLARRYAGPRGQEALMGDAEEGMAEMPANDDSADLERWALFHLGVAQLPSEEREVVGLIFYHGWEQAEVAELFGVHVRTIQRYWSTALIKLQQRLKDKESV